MNSINVKLKDTGKLLDEFPINETTLVWWALKDKQIIIEVIHNHKDTAAGFYNIPISGMSSGVIYNINKDNIVSPNFASFAAQMRIFFSKLKTEDLSNVDKTLEAIFYKIGKKVK